jgi:hypothetical protein
MGVEITPFDRLGKTPRVGAMDPHPSGGTPEPPDLDRLTGGGIEQLQVLPPALMEVARRVGTRRAEDVFELRRQGVVGTVPELIAYEWLQSRGYAFEFQSSQLGGRRRSGGAVVDFVIQDLSPNGVMMWRIQGEYWHQGPDVERKDEVQRVRLLNVRMGGRPVAAVVDLYESDIYDRYPEVMLRAEAGMQLRGGR